MSDEQADEQIEYAMVMPFVACASEGGPFEDEPFVAGYQAGRIDAKLAAAPPETESLAFMVHAGLARQVELIGMLHDFPVCETEEVAEGWVTVRLQRKHG